MGNSCPMTRIIMSLGFVVNGNQVLLGMKKRGFGEGKWNGFGGKLHNGETLEEGMLRELEEECGLIARSPEKRAYLEFFFEDGKIIEGHVFLIQKFSGEPVETGEMRPRWFNVDKIPYDGMWEDDRFWLPQFLAGKNIRATFHFDLNDRMISKDVRIADFL